MCLAKQSSFAGPFHPRIVPGTLRPAVLSYFKIVFSVLTDILCMFHLGLYLGSRYRREEHCVSEPADV
jgi:hypothetical protein